MAAISAGMLIYAAAVEMLAGDFIMDPSLWKSDVKKQALALISLLVGAGAMALIGYVFFSLPCVLFRRLFSIECGDSPSRLSPLLCGTT
jgi:hypothetical protein